MYAGELLFDLGEDPQFAGFRPALAAPQRGVGDEADLGVTIPQHGGSAEPPAEQRQILGVQPHRNELLAPQPPHRLAHERLDAVIARCDLFVHDTRRDGDGQLDRRALEFLERLASFRAQAAAHLHQAGQDLADRVAVLLEPTLVVMLPRGPALLGAWLRHPDAHQPREHGHRVDHRDRFERRAQMDQVFHWIRRSMSSRVTSHWPDATAAVQSKVNSRQSFMSRPSVLSS